MGKSRGITFPSGEIPSIIGFPGIPDGSGVHIGYKMKSATSNRLMKTDETAAYYGEFAVDLCSGKHLFFIYTNIIEYQYVGDTKAPLLRVIDSKQRLKNGVCELEPTHRIVFSNLDYKNSYQTLYNQYRLSFAPKRKNWFPFREPVKSF